MNLGFLHRKRKRLSTSKQILRANFIVAFFLLAAVILGAFLEKDMSQVAAISIGWDAQLTTSIGFYYWKAKNENRSKYAMKLVEKLAKKHGFENVVDLAQVVLKD